MSAREKRSPPAATEGRTSAAEATAKANLSSRSMELRRVRFRAPTGREWAYTGKRGLVLRMLGPGRTVTQWDCLPWHTRLGGTIHVMREDGLAIETTLEGEFRHARYRLLTSGELVSEGEQ